MVYVTPLPKFATLAYKKWMFFYSRVVIQAVIQVRHKAALIQAKVDFQEDNKEGILDKHKAAIIQAKVEVINHNHRYKTYYQSR